MTAVALNEQRTVVPPVHPNPISARVGTIPVDSQVDIIVPVYNEEVDLGPSVRRLHEFLATFPFRCSVTIADNASTDDTWQIAADLSRELVGVRAVHLEQKGRGRALRATWMESSAPVVAYMDVDLSTDLNGLLPLVAPLVSGHSEVAIGSRLQRSSRVERGHKREFISRSYNRLLRAFLGVSFSDAQCGFKAMRSDVARRVLPWVKDNNWFFDTELLVLAQRSGMRISEVPVDWVDDPGTTVNIVSTALEDLRGMARVSASLWRREIPLAQLRGIVSDPPSAGGDDATLLGQVLRFAGVGVLSTLAYLALYWLLRMGMGAQAANLIALVTTAVANTAANRWLTFGVRGRRHLWRDHAGGLAVFGVGLLLTSGTLWALGQWWPTASRAVELAGLVVANAVATLLRFVTLRQLAHHRR